MDSAWGRAGGAAGGNSELPVSTCIERIVGGVGDDGDGCDGNDTSPRVYPLRESGNGADGGRGDGPFCVSPTGTEGGCPRDE
jgi:hypothetical protein